MGGSCDTWDNRKVRRSSLTEETGGPVPAESGEPWVVGTLHPVAQARSRGSEAGIDAAATSTAGTGTY